MEMEDQDAQSFNITETPEWKEDNKALQNFPDPLERMIPIRVALSSRHKANGTDSGRWVRLERKGRKEE